MKSTAQAKDDAARETLWRTLDRDGNGRVGFPEFVDWAERFFVLLPIGVRGSIGPNEDLASAVLPPFWSGPLDREYVARIEVTDEKEFQDLQGLLNETYRPVLLFFREAHR